MALIAIIPRHLRILGALIERRKTDQYGCIGWRALQDDPEPFTMDQLFKPLMDRGLIEDMTRTMGNGGTYFVRITPLGQFCYGIGYMIKDPRVTTEAEIKKYITDIPRGISSEAIEHQKELNAINNAVADIFDVQGTA